MKKLLAEILEEFKRLTPDSRKDVLLQRKNHDIARFIREIEEVNTLRDVFSLRLKRLLEREPLVVRGSDFKRYRVPAGAANDERFALAA